MNKKIFVVLLVLLTAVALTGWAGGAQEEAATGAAEEDTGEVVVEEWEIPFLNVLSGPIASIGEYLQWGADRAAQEINEAGGIAGKPVTVKAIDTGMSPEKGSVEMAKIADSALVSMGPVPEPVIMAAMPIAVENGLYSMTATTSYEYAVEFFPWSISWFAPTKEKLPPVVTEWAKMQDLDRVVQFVESYGPWPGMAEAHEIGLEAAGVEVLKQVDVPTDAVTFGPLVVKALEQNPDGIVFACNAEKIAKIIIELKSRGWEDLNNLLVFNSGDAPELYTTGGKQINGTMIYNYTNDALDTPRWNAYKKAYMEDHDGTRPPALSTHYYDAVYMIKEAIEETGVTGDPDKLKEERIKIRDYCNNVKNFEGIQFTWSMSDGVPTDKPLFLFEIQDGDKELVKEVRPE
ncbi:MAG: ABC transporter substrate-binding protein [Spirochaetales bacterium]|nr:ABC transporter substrate-binding protein [Spirochaetales bacterium]MCF7938445.1 ABC transporter substrate-binding protein [Spirochaetales bacterium]